MPGAYDRSRRAAIVRNVSPNFESAIANFFGTKAPNTVVAQGTHDAYVAALTAHGTEVSILPSLEQHPDCCFVEDTAVMIDGKAIIPNMGHPSREGEQTDVANYLSEDFEIINMPKSATLDGGDVVFFDEKFMIGVSTRTNRLGAEFLSEHVRESGFDVELIDIPSSSLHLTTVCSSPRPGMLLAAEGHLTSEQLSPLAEDIVWVPNEESYAANTIGYSNDRVIIAEGFPITRRVLMDEGFQITSVDMDAIMQADGSLTCLSLFTK
tara:strand:- start:280 stop:1077 length:798 start_codon:yes stop_codon:yes gene_type:complete